MLAIARVCDETWPGSGHRKTGAETNCATSPPNTDISLTKVLEMH
jgi:hypothetical protein